MSEDASTTSSPDNSPASLERLVEEALSPDVSDKDDSEADIVRRVLLSESYRGQFAHPNILRQLDDIIEGGAERAFSMSEREQLHRHSCDKQLIGAETTALARESSDRRLVIILTFGFLFLSLILSFIAVLTKHGAVGVALGGAGVLVAVIGIFKLRPRGSSAEDGGQK